MIGTSADHRWGECGNPRNHLLTSGNKGQPLRLEHWSQLPHERKRLFKLIKETKAAGVVFISGDVHRGELTTMDGGVGYPLFDLTSSGLNRGHPEWRFDRPNRHRVGSLQWGNNFGLIVLDWEREEPRIRLQIIDEEGDIAIQRKIELSTLQPGVIP